MSNYLELYSYLLYKSNEYSCPHLTPLNPTLESVNPNVFIWVLSQRAVPYYEYIRYKVFFIWIVLERIANDKTTCIWLHLYFGSIKTSVAIDENWFSIHKCYNVDFGWLLFPVYEVHVKIKITRFSKLINALKVNGEHTL